MCSATGRPQIGPPVVLRVDINHVRHAVAALEGTTWCVELRKNDGDRFVVLPAGSLERPPSTVGVMVWRDATS